MSCFLFNYMYWPVAGQVGTDVIFNISGFTVKACYYHLHINAHFFEAHAQSGSGRFINQRYGSKWTEKNRKLLNVTATKSALDGQYWHPCYCLTARVSCPIGLHWCNGAIVFVSSVLSMLIVTMTQTTKKKTPVLINWTCPLTQAHKQNGVHFLCFISAKAHVFISASDWVWHPEMFTEATRRQMRPQKSNACMTQATKCFCSSTHHWQCIEWQVQTQPSRSSIPVPAAAQCALTRCWWVSVPGTRGWRDTLSLRHQDGMIVSERFFVGCPSIDTFLLSGSIYEAITPSNYTKSVQQVAFSTDKMTDTLLANTDTQTC